MKLTTQTIMLLISIMAVIVIFITGLSFVSWYQTEIKHEEGRLYETVQSRARIIEAIARYDNLEGIKLGRGPSLSRENTLSQVRIAHESFKGFGETGEFTLAQLTGNNIEFVLRHRHKVETSSKKINFDSKFAQPMKAALGGRSGVMIGKDYRGVDVLAAYEPVAVLNMGIVAKIDLSEIRQPFIEKAIQLSFVALVFILGGSFFFLRTSAPLLRVVERNEELLKRVVNSTDDFVFSKDVNGIINFVNKVGEHVVSKDKHEIINKHYSQIFPKEVNERFALSDTCVLEEKVKDEFISEISVDGSVRFFQNRQSPVFSQNSIITGITCVARDITDEIENQKIIQLNQILTNEIIDTAADAIILLDEMGQIEIWNPAAEGIFGYSFEEVKGVIPHELLILKRNQESSLFDLNNCLKTGHLKRENMNLELTAKRKNGLKIDIELSLSAIERKNGWSTLCITRDVSLKNKSIDTLREAYKQVDISSSKYKSLFDTSKTSIWDEDFSEVLEELDKIRALGVRDVGVYLHAHQDIAFALASKIKINDVNDETLRLYGAKSKEEFYNSVSETFSGDAIDIFIDEVKAIWEQKKSFTARATQRKLDGTIIYVMIHVPIPLTKDEYKNIPVTITDITSLVLSQEKLENQKSALDKLQFIIDSSPAVAFLWKNEDGWPVEYVSNNVSQWGYSKEQFESRRLLFTEIVNSDDLIRVGIEVAEKIKENALGFYQEYRIVTADGSVRWIDDRTWIKKNDKGEITHFQGICLDITERKDTERLLWQSQKSESLGNMAGGIAHDFNNMLLPIIALADLSFVQLEEGNPLKKRMEKIKDAGVRAQELVKSLMVFAREEEVQFERVSIDDLLLVTVDLLRKTMPASMEISYERRCEVNPCKKCCFMGSQGQIQSMIINIAKNAADALESATGKLDIQCHLSSVLPQGIDVGNLHNNDEYIHIRMKDNGPGMDEKILNRIFDPFFTTKPVGEGTGMGMAMALSVVKVHEGFIKANSRKGYGATFDIFLPLIKEKE